MKKVIVLVIVAIVFVVGSGFAIASCTKVEPGYVGIRVNMYGNQRGVEDFPIRTGRVWHNPVTEDVYVFPTYLQTITWTRDINEGSPIDESISFNSIEGASINADVSLSYRVIGEKVPQLFVEFRQPINVITKGYMRSQIRDTFARKASKMRAIDIFGTSRSTLLNEVKSDLNKRLGPRGFEFDTVAFVGELRADQRVTNSINAVIEATQKAIEAENKVRQTKAEADQRVAKQRGESDSRVVEAEARVQVAKQAVLEAQQEAEATLTRARAQAEANETINRSITPQLIRYRSIDQWNGKLPQVTGSGGIPLIDINSGSEN